MDKCSTTKILGLALAGIGALAATNVMAASPVRVGGQIQADFVSFSGDNKRHDRTDPTDVSAAGYDFHSGGDIRRAEFYLKGELDDVWSYQIQWDADRRWLDDTWLGFAGFDPLWVAVGQVTVPFGAENFGSSSATTFMERSSVYSLKPGEGVGVYAEGNMDMFGYSFAAVAPSSNDTHASVGRGTNNRRSSDPLTVGARFFMAPVATDGNVYHFGVSYATRKIDSDENGYIGARPSIWVNALDLVRSQGVAGDVERHTSWGVEGAGIMGPLYAHAEYAMTELEGRGALKDQDVKAWFAQVSYMLTGESRIYDATSGTFGGVKPASNMGAWEVAARYNVFDASDVQTGFANGLVGDITGKMKDWTLGVNWYANDNVKFQMNYVRATAEFESGAKDRDLNVLAVRAQVRF